MKEKFLNMIEDFKDKAVLVVGDIILDKFIYGDVERISPEAPIPVVHVNREEYMPGGAGNTAANIAALGGIVHLVSLVGEDLNAEILKKELEKRKIRYNLVEEPNKETITKIRIVGQKQQVVRVDYETVGYVDKEIEDKILDIIKALFRGVDTVVISDYGKGVITKALAREIIGMCNAAGKKVIVDPKPQHKEFYKDAFLITPNNKESLEMLREEDVEKRGKELSKELNANVLITLGEKGMALFEKGKDVVLLPTEAKEVYDVSGAGDTVVAGIALALAANASLEEAALLANHAAGIVVGKLGTATVSSEELADKFKFEVGKIKSREEIAKLVFRLKKEGKKIVTTSGFFDLLHFGHIKLLQDAKKLGDVLIVAINTDDSVKRLKGPNRPILTENERAAILSALDSVNYVCLFEEDTPIELLSEIKPHIHVKGADRKLDEIIERETVESFGGKIVLIPIIEGASTTQIIDKILERYK